MNDNPLLKTSVDVTISTETIVKIYVLIFVVFLTWLLFKKF